jgi:GT2 family glycosyltransferase
VSGAFVGPGGHAEAAVVVVTYNSAADVGALLASLRVEAESVRLRVVVVDNGSTDDTVAILAAEPGVVLVEPGGNLGYAGGINAAVAHAGAADSVLVLNPDLLVEPGAVRAMLGRLARPGVGVVVPLVRASDGSVYRSLRREPSVLRSVGDALLGNPRPWRPEWSSETVADPACYSAAHPVDWATGAAVLVRRDVAESVGDWDERFFLYSEETDYLRRVRAGGHEVWFEPSAGVRHHQGGSGSSPELDALMAVNRVRYARKHHSRAGAAAVRATGVLHALVRGRQPAWRDIRNVLLDERSWPRLPAASRWPLLEEAGGAIVIPAHNEAAVIARTLAPLARLVSTEVVVVCNGCSDATADVARGFDFVRVVEIAQPSKAAALNAGDAVATAWPRLYLDADVVVQPGAVAAVFADLDGGAHLAARPAYRYDTAGASALVRRYYRARTRMPSTSAALWGAGAYAMGEAGHRLFGRFDERTADDLLVDAAFPRAAKAVLATQPVLVRTPRTVRALVAVLTRQHRGNTHAGTRRTTSTTVRELLATVRSPSGLVDAVVYAGLSLAGRTAAAATSDAHVWERDDSSRTTRANEVVSRNVPPYRHKSSRATPGATAAVAVDDEK